MSEKHSPLDQFLIQPIKPIEIMGVDFSYTNSSLFLTIAACLIAGLYMFAIRRHKLVPGRWQSLAEMGYEFIASMVRENMGSKGQQYFPFIFTLFMFVLVLNLLGLLPYSFTSTSHVAVTFGLAMMVFFIMLITGIVTHGMKFLNFFLPQGTPWWLAPLIIAVEVFSYLSRPVSLSIRLAANMVAGHVLLKVMAGFVIALGWLGAFPFAFLVGLTAFEFFIAVLQAYIFTILTCVYFSDALHSH